MHVRGLGGGDDGAAVGLRVHARNVVGDGAVEQADILRQVAHMGAQVRRLPLIERGAIQAHRAAGQRPDAGEGAGEGGFSRAARADDAEALPRLQLEGDAADQQALAARRG